MALQINQPEQFQDSNDLDIRNTSCGVSPSSVTIWRKKFSVGCNDIKRHWHTQSEPYTGCDALLTALENGWQIMGQIYSEQYVLPSGRTSTLYQFKLQLDDESTLMTVISTPYLLRLIGRLS